MGCWGAKEDGKLADGKFDFLKKPLSLDDLADIPKKAPSEQRGR